MAASYLTSKALECLCAQNLHLITSQAFRHCCAQYFWPPPSYVTILALAHDSSLKSLIGRQCGLSNYLRHIKWSNTCIYVMCVGGAEESAATWISLVSHLLTGWNNAI